MMRSNPFFSVIVPTYNRGAFVVRALRSIIDQTFEDFELIVVDDGSTDNTREIVNSINDPRIKYYFKPNEERSIARNFGISRSSGTYVNFLDSDDYCHEHHLETAYGLLNQKGVPELLHLAYEEKGVDGFSASAVRSRTVREVNRNLIFDNVLYGGSFFIRRNVLQGIRFIHHKDASFSEDWYLWLRLAARYPVHTADIVTVVVTEHNERSLRRVVPERLERSLLLVVQELKKDLVFLDYYRGSFNYFVAECLSLIALHYVGVKNLKACQYLIRSVRVYPLIVKRKRFWALLRNLLFKRKKLAP